jgi:hypothetical protein
MIQLWWNPKGPEVLFQSGDRYYAVGDGGHTGYAQLPTGSRKLRTADDKPDVAEFLEARFGKLPFGVRAAAWQAAITVVRRYRESGRVPTTTEIHDIPDLLDPERKRS